MVIIRIFALAGFFWCRGICFFLRFPFFLLEEWFYVAVGGCLSFCCLLLFVFGVFASRVVVHVFCCSINHEIANEHHTATAEPICGPKQTTNCGVAKTRDFSRGLEKHLKIAIYIGIRRKREKTSTPSLPETYSQKKKKKP